MSDGTGPGAGDVDTVVVRRRLRVQPLEHVAPLDGLRAVAVAGVLLYHARFEWIPGGFLGVSVFFTLSGFLITSLLLRQWAGDEGGIALRSFWGRRFRRLLPASWATMGLIVVAAALGVWNSDQLRSLRGDVPFSLLEVVNWHFIAQDRSYGAGFEAPSPLEHFWSLAVEQQFYVVLPVLVVLVLSAGALRSQRRRVQRLMWVLGALAVYSAAANGWLARSSIDRAYLGTDTRMAELLVGALLACVTLERLRSDSAVVRRRLGLVGAGAVAATAVLWASATVQSSWLYPWGLLGSAFATTAIIAAALQGGALARALSWGPLVRLGRISYGVYLLHWPVFLWLTPARTGLGQWPLFGLRVAVTLAASVVMFRLLEQPVRTGALLRGRSPLPVALVFAAALLAGTAWTTRDLPPPSALSLASAGDGALATTTTLPPPPLPNVLVVGDEMAEVIGGAVARSDDLDVTIAAAPGCGLAVAGYVVAADGVVERDVDRCNRARQQWEEALEQTRPDVVLVPATLRDAADRRLRVETPWGGPQEPSNDAVIRTEIADVVDAMGRLGSEVVLVTIPPVRRAEAPAGLPYPPPNLDAAQVENLEGQRAGILVGAPGAGIRENDDARIEHLNTLMSQVAQERDVRLIDVAGEVRGFPSGPFDPLRRSVGVGLTSLGQLELAAWLAPQLSTVDRSTPSVPPPVVDPDEPLPAAPEPGPRRVVAEGDRVDALVVGDSAALMTALGLVDWSTRQDDWNVAYTARFGCPIARGGSLRFQRVPREIDEQLCDWTVEFPQLLDAHRPDVVVLSSSVWEVVDRRLPGDDRYRSIGSADLDRYILREFLSAIDLLGSDGATVVVLTQPRLHSGLDQGFDGLPESEAARMDRLNELLEEAVQLRPGVATLVDLRGWMRERPEGEMDPVARPDGVHFTEAFAEVVAEWLGPQLDRIARGV